MKTNAVELRARIFERRLVTAIERVWFFPDVALPEVLTEQVVADVISFTSITPHEQQEIVEYILKDARKIFCILVCVQAVQYIEKFFRLREADGRLPLTPARLEDIGIGNAVQEFRDWQWEYVAPVFDKSALKLDPSVILPFRSEQRIPDAVGGYGAVRKVELYNVHQKLLAGSSEETVVVALKELRPDTGRPDAPFERERSVLQLLRSSHHPHIIELLGSFHQGDSFNLFFPLAEGDLGKLFTDGHPRFQSKESFYRSIVGLASALNHIHAFKYKSNNGQTIPYKIFHRDLKPANILIRQGRLIIADFGLSKYKDGNMVSATLHTPGTPSYEPPESQNPDPDDYSETKVGRGADMWAFGCILSEIATFMTKGASGIKDYREERRKSVLPGYWPDECFHASSTEVKGGVKEWLRRLKVESSEDVEMQKLLGYVAKIMVPDPKSRPNSEKVLEMVSDLHPGAADELTSLLLGRVESMLLSLSLSPERSPPPPISRIAAVPFEVPEDPQDLCVLYQGSDQPGLQVDVIAVHGLNGGSLAGWEDGGSIWLRDFLPIGISSARIISYGYDSLGLFSGLSVDRLKGAARVFLNRLKRMRESENAHRRPMVLIAHSIGGFLVKQAIIQAEQEHRFQDIQNSIYGICFFGTPHREHRARSLETSLCNIANTAYAPQPTRQCLIECFRNNHGLLRDINQQFSTVGFRIFNFFETKETLQLGMVVDEESASMVHATNVMHQGLGLTHENLCKYPNDIDLSYRRVSSKVCALVKLVQVESSYYLEREESQRNRAPPQSPEPATPAPYQVINFSNSIGSMLPPQFMAPYLQQTPSSPPPLQQSSQPPPTSSALPPQYMPNYPQQTPSPPPPPQQSSLPRRMSSVLPPQYMPAHPQQTPSPPSPPQQSPQPRQVAQRQAGPVPAPKPKPQPTVTIASIEAKLEVQNKTLYKIGEKRSARERERKALGPKRQSMGEPKYQNEYGRLTNAIAGLEHRRREESAKKEDLQETLKRLKIRTV